MSLVIGRLLEAEVGRTLPHDAPEKQVAAMLSKQDEIIAKLNTILAAVEAATDGNSLFTALDVAGTKAVLSPIELTV